MEPSPPSEPSAPTPPVVPERPDDRSSEPEWDERLSAFVHENLVVYNPLYLLSAALVLGGLVLLLLEPALESEIGGLAISGLAELYAFALIGGTAVLVRAGERRAAVMLGLLAILFQCDVTLHVERAALMSTGGALAALLWVALFHTKLRLLCAALGLTLSPWARRIPTIAAAALACLVQLLPHLSLDARGSLVALVAFGLGALALYTNLDIHSAVGFDYRGRRAIRATWAMLAAGFALHVLDWGIESGLPLALLGPALALLSLRARSTTELHAFGIVIFTLAATALIDPSVLWVVATMAAAALALRALRKAELESVAEEPTEAAGPYRLGSAAVEAPARPRTVFVLAPVAERERLLLASASALHLAGWSAMTPHGIPHEHVLVLDAALVAVALAAVARGRRWASGVPAIAVVADLLVETGWLRVPRGAGEAGAWALASGFVLLGAGLRVSLRARRATGELCSERRSQSHDGPTRTEP